MIETNNYSVLLLAVAGGMLTLLGSVGIFIPIIVQKRLDRLQDILEDFINLSYRSETNLTGLMHNLIEKYQMNYLFPHKPRFLILRYIDVNIFFILVIWITAFLLAYQPPLSPHLLLQLIPLLIGIYASFFFRRLLRNTIDLEKPLLETIIPPPVKLRSISYLSHFVNLSVKAILTQARLTLHVNLSQEEEEKGQVQAEVFLKEELSCDDFFYYLILQEEEKALFSAFGEIILHFPSDPVTGKPVPVCRNLNIPLGSFAMQPHGGDLSAKLLIFTRGEKHPVQYTYRLAKGIGFLSSASGPEIVVNHQITYTIKQNQIKILAYNASIPLFENLSPFFLLNGERYYLNVVSSTDNLTSHIVNCQDKVFID